MKVISSRSSEMKREIIIFIGCINVEVGVVAFLSIYLGASRNSKERSDMRCSDQRELISINRPTRCILVLLTPIQRHLWRPFPRYCGEARLDPT
jgi:hypothetical protein